MGVSRISYLTTMKNLNLFLLGLLLLFSVKLNGQTIPYDQEYLLAKQDLREEKFNSAAQRFKVLLSKDPANPKAAYVAFYYGLATYNDGEADQAKTIFQDLVRDHKAWPKLPEAHLWLAKIYFELANPMQAVYHANVAATEKTLKPRLKEFKNIYYPQLDSVALSSILTENKNDTVAARFLARWQVQTPSDRQNTGLLMSLIRDYKLDSTELGLTAPPDIFKAKYRVAVMLPLFSERLWHSGVYLQKSLAVDIYEGIQMAFQEFDTTKISIEVFDTKRDSALTHNIIASGQLAGMDAIIGPLYPEPIRLVSAYAKERKINFLNPVSTNSDIIADNPFAFLLRTGDASIGEIVAGYTRANIDTGAFAVYYGRRRTDSLTAYQYSTLVQADSFLLAIRQKANTAEARQIFDSLTSSVQVVDTLKLRQMLREGENVRFKPLMDSLLLKKDSLGHIFIASDNQAIASEVMAAIAYRGDSTQLIGVGNWFSVPNASLDLMESLNVWLAMQEFENMLSPHNLKLDERYRLRYRQRPSKYVFYGYYAMKFLGESLLKYGVYFQNGYKYEGNFDPLFNFRNSQDNQQLVLYRLDHGHPVMVLREKTQSIDH